MRQIRGSTQIMDDSVPPVKISDQGHGGTLDSDMVDGKHASELLAGVAGVGCIRADGSVPLVADWDVGGHQIKWFLFHKGTAFPTTPSPVEGQPFYRTDESKLYIYDGTTWSELGGAPHNILDGDVHPDSVAQAVTRGSIIYGDSTPKWNELTIGAANRVILSDGTDLSWVQITAGIVANTPAGGIVATDVQAAINELDTEKAGIADAETISADWLWSTDKKIQFRDAQIYIHSPSDGVVHFEADGSITFGADFKPDATNALDLGAADALIAILYMGEPGIIYWGASQDVALGRTLANRLALGTGDHFHLPTTGKVQFRDTAIFIHSSVDGTLLLEADGYIDLSASVRLDTTTGKLEFYDGANWTVNLYPSAADVLKTDDALYVVGNITTDGTVDGVDIDAFKTSYDAHAARHEDTGADEMDIGGLMGVVEQAATVQAGAPATQTGKLWLDTDATPTPIAASNVVNTPAGGIVAITVQAAIDELDTEKAGIADAETITNDWTWGTDKKIFFRDAAIYIHSGADGFLDLVADTGIRLNADTTITAAIAVLDLVIANTTPSGQGDVILTLDRAADGNSAFIQYFVDGAPKWQLGTGIVAIDENFRLRQGTSGAVVILANFTDAVANTLVLDQGNVGIGTATPSEKVEVSGRVSAIGNPAWHAPVSEGFFYHLNVHGATITGKGTTYDVALISSAGGAALVVLTGTSNIEMGGTLDVAGCVTDGTCEIMKGEDALSIIRDILNLGDGRLDGYGHEHMDMERIWNKYPFLIHRREDDAGVKYFDRLGSKSDLLYVAALQLAKRVEELEARIPV